MVELIRSGFGARSPLVEGRTLTDKGDLFVLRPTVDGRFVREGLLVTTVGGGLRVARAGLEYPQEFLLLDILGHQEGESLERAAVTPQGTESLTLPLSASGAALQFRCQCLNRKTEGSASW